MKHLWLYFLSLFLCLAAIIIFVIISVSRTPVSATFLLLGLDKRDDQFEKTLTTDTLILAHFNSIDSKLSLISLPRDLWDQTLLLKINSYYPYYLKTNSTDYFTPIETRIASISGQKISGTLIVSTQNLIDFVTKIGGVDVNLPTAFTDNLYPNPAYIASPSAKIPVYITVSYPAGLTHLDAANITPFVRSRKSSDDPTTGGTDIGRIERQQLLFSAIFKKITRPSFLASSQHLSDLMAFWHSLDKNISDPFILNFIWHNWPHLLHLTLQKVTLPIKDYLSDGVIYHPDYLVAGQWVYLPVDQKYQLLQNFINHSL